MPLALVHPLEVIGPTIGYTGVAVATAAVLAMVADSRAGSPKVLSLFGKYSYGLYVVHLPIIHLMVAAGLRPATLGASLGAYWIGALVFFALVIAVSFGVAVPSWHFFESRLLATARAAPLTTESLGGSTARS